MQAGFEDIDQELVFTINHPLAKYTQVVKSFKYRTAISNTDNHKALLAGAILSTLRHHNLLRIHDRHEALWANNAIVSQSRNTKQLLALLHRLLQQEDRLANLSKSIHIKGEKYPRKYEFTLEACHTMGQEYKNEDKYFLANLTAWIGELLPPTTEELLVLDTMILKERQYGTDLDNDIQQIQLDDGRIVQFDDVVESIKNNLEDNIARRVRRMPVEKLITTVKASIKLMASDAYGNIFTPTQVTKLYKMVTTESYNEKILAKVITTLTTAASKELKQQRRNKIFECIGWLKASDLQFKSNQYAEQAFLDILEAKVTETESLQDRLARLAGGK